MHHGSIAPFMTTDHRHCDEHLAAAEEHVQKKRWPDAEAAFTSWRRALDCHLAREENLLFPAFERATGNTEGPTAVMRLEHAQMRDLVESLAQALAARDGKRFLSLCESLMLLVQQHNMKEENVLYPMCDQLLANRQVLVGEIAALSR
ncbi:MAG TPA: hemerythrin domain-containing protein [Planctomycetota bacterium]